MRRYWVLFISVFKISACTFGGGFVIIPLMRERFVEKLGWIEEEEMLDLAAIAQASPGAIAVNASVLIGYHVARIPGVLLAVFGTVLPPLIIISIISLLYQRFRDNSIANMVMAGMLCGVAAVICNVVIDMAKTVFQKKHHRPVLVMLVTFIAVHFFSANIMLVIFACGVIGAIGTWYQDRKQKECDKR